MPIIVSTDIVSLYVFVPFDWCLYFYHIICNAMHMHFFFVDISSKITTKLCRPMSRDRMQCKMNLCKISKHEEFLLLVKWALAVC